MRPLKMLVADDDAGDRLLIERTLNAIGQPITVETCHDFDSFKAAIKARKYDCVLMDFNLSPVCNAEMLLALLRDERPECPAIVVSNSDEQEVVVRSFRSGSIDFLNKSDAADPQALWGVLESVLKRALRKRTERRIGERRIRALRELADTDPLTGLANRRALESVIGPERRQTFDRRGHTTVMMVDIDHFKRINDQYGHETGDRVLRSVAAVISQSSPQSAQTVRWGGEEFLVLCPGLAAVTARFEAERLRQAIASKYILADQGRISVTVSIGVTTVRSDEVSLDTVKLADEALYLAKESGRNRVCTHEMVAFSKLVEPAKNDSPEDTLRCTLERARGILGPTQFEHVTAHSEAVGAIAAKIARHLGASTTEVDRVRLAGLCHDIGKVAVPDALLSKVGDLSPAERFILEKHADDSALLAQRLGADRHTTECIRHHHDRFDTIEAAGFDQPRILKHKSMAASQIIKVADAFATMTAGRTYKPRMTVEAAKEELLRNRGGQFDPTVVDAAMCVV